MKLRTAFYAGVVASFATTAPVLAQEVVIAIGSEPTTLDPQLREDGGERAVNDNIFETLMVRQADGSLEPGLAASVPTQVAADQWEVKLRDGISFHNGEPFNADAVVYSVNRIIDPEFNSEQASFFASITGAEKVDDLTVHINTNGADPILPARLYWMKMVPPGAGESEDFAENPVGTGPYKFIEWNRGTEITLGVNEDYWGEAPEIKDVNFRFISEFGTRLSSLLSGE
ncbi:MAG: ABC transporter substrate-binding protein, partial [Maritimibacter sp.]|nr:ABC transporter substrate-binding protein [Maritimibacter sp.]